MARTQDQIVNQIQAWSDQDVFGFQRSVMLEYLDYEHAKPYLKDGVTAEQWEECRSEYEPLDALRDYMPFAFGKAYGQRGLSANRSIQKALAWLWLAEEDEMMERVTNEYDRAYNSYGLPILIHICQHYGWDIPEA